MSCVESRIEREEGREFNVSLAISEDMMFAYGNLRNEMKLQKLQENVEDMEDFMEQVRLNHQRCILFCCPYQTF